MVMTAPEIVLLLVIVLLTFAFMWVGSLSDAVARWRLRSAEGISEEAKQQFLESLQDEKS